MYWGSPESEARQLPEDGVSPLVNESLAGYDRWAPHDDSSWFAMLQPGAQGFGLHLCTVAEAECCVGYHWEHYRSAIWTDKNTPWLLPTAVEWVSVMGTDGKPLPWVISDFDVDYPVVGIRAAEPSFAVNRYMITNVNVEFGFERFECMWDPTSDLYEGSIIGLVPIWEIMPMRKEFAESINTAIDSMQLRSNYMVLGDCWCTIEDTPCEENCPHDTDYRATCTCAAKARAQELLERAWTELDNPKIYMPTEAEEVWDHAVGQYYRGWQVVFEAMERGETWASYWWRRQSPFSDSPGLSDRRPKDLIDSISSATLQESSLAS